MKNITEIYEASLLGDIDDTIEFGDKHADIYNFVDWWIDSAIARNGIKLTRKDERTTIKSKLVKIISNDKGDFTIDVKAGNRDEDLYDIFDYTIIYLSKKHKVPKFVKSIKFMGVGQYSGTAIDSEITDMSFLSVSSCSSEWGNNGNMDIYLDNSLKSAKELISPIISCGTCKVSARWITNLVISSGSSISNLYLTDCDSLKSLQGNIENINEFKPSKFLAKELIKMSLGLNSNTKITI
jgi:hypothetical protein